MGNRQIAVELRRDSAGAERLLVDVHDFAQSRVDIHHFAQSRVDVHHFAQSRVDVHHGRASIPWDNTLSTRSAAARGLVA